METNIGTYGSLFGTRLFIIHVFICVTTRFLGVVSSCESKGVKMDSKRCGSRVLTPSSLDKYFMMALIPFCVTQFIVSIINVSSACF